MPPCTHTHTERDMRKHSTHKNNPRQDRQYHPHTSKQTENSSGCSMPLYMGRIRKMLGRASAAARLPFSRNRNAAAQAVCVYVVCKKCLQQCSAATIGTPTNTRFDSLGQTRVRPTATAPAFVDRRGLPFRSRRAQMTAFKYEYYRHAEQFLLFKPLI